MCPWYPPDPHKDGSKIPLDQYDNIIKQVNAYAAKQSWSSDYKLQVRFKGQFCYVASVEKDDMICPLGRLRYLRPDRWLKVFSALLILESFRSNVPLQG